MRVLIVEDEPDLADAVRDGLRLEAIAADVVGDGESAWEALTVNVYDVVVLDRDLPGTSGDEVARRIVAEKLTCRILMLTAADELEEKVTGFELGADDYLTKPFQMRELVVRLRALGRRPTDAAPPVLEFAGMRLDPFRREVFRDGRYVRLTRKQFAVLEVLLAARGGVVSAESLLERAWDENADPFTNAVRGHHLVAAQAVGGPVADPHPARQRLPGCRPGPHVSARLRLTLSYAGFLLVAGAALVALLVYIIRFVPDGDLTGTGAAGFVPDRGDLLSALWPRIAVVMAGLAVVGLVGGWVLAGRMLRPLHDMHAVAQRVAAGSLDHRVRLRGRHDEFRELADTFDTMLDRLQAAFDEQRRFAANASHELRTPYTIERAVLDVALADPAAVDVPRLLNRLDRTNRRGTETVQAMLTLAALDQERIPAPEPVDLAEVTDAVVADLAPLAEQAGVTIHAEIGEADFDGVPPLVRQLVANVVLNAVRHNTGPGGTVSVGTGTSGDGRAQLQVTNTGPHLSAELVATITEPFARGAGRVSATGSGLGLSIVHRIAAIHGATLHLHAPDSGGLEVTVTFPELADSIRR